MDVERGEPQTVYFVQVVLFAATSIEELAAQSFTGVKMPSLLLIQKLEAIYKVMSNHTQGLGNVSLSHLVPLQLLHLFYMHNFSVIVNLNNHHTLDMDDLRKFQIRPVSTISRSLSSLKIIIRVHRSFFHDGFVDPVHEEDRDLSFMRTQIRLRLERAWEILSLIEKTLETMSFLQDAFEAHIKSLQSCLLPPVVITCLVLSPLQTCGLCHERELDEGTVFAVVDSCRHLFCLSCLSERLRDNNSCPICRVRIRAYVSSSVLKRSSFKTTRPRYFYISFKRRSTHAFL